MAADFEKQSYWRNRFASETAFEWLVPSEAFIPFVEPYLRASGKSGKQRILHLGSGTSDLHVRLREKGYTDVTNVDYEPLALDRGRAMEERAFGDVVMKYVVADVTQTLNLDRDMPAELELDTGQGRNRPEFDIVVDKSTADAVACGGDEAVLAMARYVRACLKTGGVWISLSYSATRFEVRGEGEEGEMPFEVEVIRKIPTPKARASDPDVYYWCYLLRPVDR